MIDYCDLITALEQGKVRTWAKQLPQQIADGLSPARFGDIPKWEQVLSTLPAQICQQYDFTEGVKIGAEQECLPAQLQTIDASLRQLMPWRKGPFDVFGLHIDTEWRSDWKWARLKPHIASLEGRSVLDVGCGNGYYCLRMLGEGAARVIGIDPSPRFVYQFYALRHFLPPVNADVLPLAMEDLPENLAAFDTTFSMGVLYHRRSPMDHLRQLRSTLRPGGELILETLIVEGGPNYCLVPQARYAQMKNVWFIPSAATLITWLNKCGFDNVRCVDATPTRTDEQRSTSWIDSQSLDSFLDPSNPALTIEGHPAPLRGIFIANRK